jgi:hypothetical protein
MELIQLKLKQGRDHLQAREIQSNQRSIQKEPKLMEKEASLILNRRKGEQAKKRSSN